MQKRNRCTNNEAIARWDMTFEKSHRFLERTGAFTCARSNGFNLKSFLRWMPPFNVRQTELTRRYRKLTCYYWRHTNCTCSIKRWMEILKCNEMAHTHTRTHTLIWFHFYWKSRKMHAHASRSPLCRRDTRGTCAFEIESWIGFLTSEYALQTSYFVTLLSIRAFN